MAKTRYKELDYVNNGDHWRFVDTSSGSTVGPLYKTKAELLADMDRYAHNFGCDGAYNPQQQKIDDLLAACQLAEVTIKRLAKTDSANGTLDVIRAAIAKAS